MKIRWTVLLIVINALLLWGIVEQISYAPGERAFNDQVRTFLPLTKTDWDGMGVSTNAGSWKVSRDHWGRWWLRSPYEWPAKTSLISRMNGTLATLPVDSAFAVSDLNRVGQSLHSYGLDNPRAVLEVSTGAQTLSYKIGSSTPLGNKVYVLSADEKEVWVVDASINEYLGYTATQIKQEGFFPFSLIELEAVEVEQKADGKSTAVETRFERKQGTNVWQLKLDDVLLPLKAGAWEGWLEKLSTAPMGEVPATDSAQQALSTTVAKLAFQTLYGRRSLVVGELDKTGERRWVQWEGSKEAFYVPVGALSILQPENFLETRPLPLDPTEITALDWTIEGVGNPVSLRKLEGGQWVLSPQNTPADPEAVRELLEKLCSSEAKPVLRTEAMPTSAGEKLRLQSAKENIEMLVSRQASGVELWRSAGHVAYQSSAWLNVPAVADLQDRRLFDGTAKELSSFSFKRLSDGKTLNFSTNNPSSQGQIQALNALLKNNLRVKRWMDDSLPTNSDGNTSAQYQMEIVLADKHLTILLWHTPQGWLGRSLATGKTFEPDEIFSGFLDLLNSQLTN